MYSSRVYVVDLFVQLSSNGSKNIRMKITKIRIARLYCECMKMMTLRV